MRSTYGLDLDSDIRNAGFSGKALNSLLKMNYSTVGELLHTPLLALCRSGFLLNHYTEYCKFLAKIKMIHYRGTNLPY